MARSKHQNRSYAQPMLSHSSLWAVSDDGLLWQINPVNQRASPVLHLADMAPEPRQKLLQQVVHMWVELCAEETCPKPPWQSRKGSQN